jgi:mannose-6-phosphate isomerase-like protein (cupin superfamily)
MNTTLDPQPIELGPDAVIHLGADLEMSALAVSAAFWTHVASDSQQLSQGRTLSVFDYTTTWTYWERHPEGDELVYLLSGDVDVLLDDDTEQRAVRLGNGSAAIVPAGTWHRAIIRAPSRLLFITPTPARTQQRPVERDHEAASTPPST